MPRAWWCEQSYVPVAERHRRADARIAQLAQEGVQASPVVVVGRKIATTFWGKSWCENLERYSDFASRLPRGRRYVRNGSVIHLDITPGYLRALVQGSSTYEVGIAITALPADRWRTIVAECTGQIGSVVELLAGAFSDEVMNVLTAERTGMFPRPHEITLDCTCPDVATMCKHVAAVLYGVGNRLDEQPELLFTLRNVDKGDLVAAASLAQRLKQKRPKSARVLDEGALSSIFGIEIESAPARKRKKRAARQG